ncbi:ANTH domain-containing protein [Choanephora cucurbitarum]|nr:ANTH domain-containing protein [Choanephora cucurbitarum]
METAVRKATRLEYRPPKEKHLLTLRSFTLQSPHLIDSILSSLERRLKERTWLITYKVLVIVHYLMRNGNSELVAEAVLHRPGVLDASRIKNKAASPSNVQNIYLYRAYLDERLIVYRQLDRDYVRRIHDGEHRLRQLSVANGLLNETEALQRQMASALKCKFNFAEGDHSITFVAYRMVIDDLLALFQAINESVVNILEHYFEMNKKNATISLRIYQLFAQQTELTIDYLNEAKRYQQDLQMNIPAVKHAPLSLAAALEEYLVEIDQQPPKTEVSPSQQPQTQQQQPQPQPQPQFMQQQQQQFMQPSYVQQPLMQPFSNTPYNEPFMDTAFSTVNRRSTLPNHLSTSQFSPQNPFATLPAHSSSSLSNHNPFRSMSMIAQQPLIPVAKPTSSYNPFSSHSGALTPPLTPNQPLYQNPFLPSSSFH